MSGLSIRSLRQLAIGAQASRPLAPATMATASRIIAVRAASTASKPSKPSKPSSETSSSSPKTIPYRRYKVPKPELNKSPEGHGEQIWIYSHMVTNQIVYSHTPVLRSNRALKQLPFNGKQTKPAKLRKDYWRPMALIQFDEGNGVVGQSVFQKMREFRRLHELSWGHQKEDFYQLDRRELGAALNDQRSNCIADMAAALAGAGQGNRIRVGGASAAAATNNSKLAEATVFWANAQDRSIAESWSNNVRHAEGLPSTKWSGAKDVEETPAPAS